MTTETEIRALAYEFAYAYLQQRVTPTAFGAGRVESTLEDLMHAVRVFAAAGGGKSGERS